MSAVKEVAHDVAGSRRSRVHNALEQGITEEAQPTAPEDYSLEVQEVLDVVDAEVATSKILNNVGNSIFFPPLPRFNSFLSTRSGKSTIHNQDINQHQDFKSHDEIKEVTEDEEVERASGSSVYDDALLDEHVRLLLTKRAKAKRVARAFRRYVGTLKGFLITLYAFLVTFWGCAIVFFIANWIKTSSEARRRYCIEICDQILCALFATIGLGFAPLRAVNTYQIIRITQCMKRDSKQCEERQKKFKQSHTFYRYKETGTHRPFSHTLTIVIIILLDSHSILQACLGGVTWGIQYRHRPTSLSATIVAFSLSCNALAAFLIWYGSHKTKKKEEIEKLLQIALKERARQKILKRQARQIQDSTFTV